MGFGCGIGVDECCGLKSGAGLVVARQVARRDVAEEEAARDGIAVGSLSQRWYFIMKLLSDCR
jgi:hypothetical protein